MRVGVFQVDAGERFAQQRVNRLAYLLETNDLDLIICPELFLSGYNVGDRLQSLAQPLNSELGHLICKLAEVTNTAIIYGYPERDDEQMYNSAACVDAQGQVIANHRKLLLPPGFESKYFQPGKQMTVFDLNSVKCAILICYDAEFPETMRAAAKAGVKFVIVPTALSDRWGVVAEKVIPARAFENGIWIAYANFAGNEGEIQYFGGSCIVDPVGQDRARAGSAEALITAQIDVNEVDIAQARLPYINEVNQLQKVLNAV